MGHAQTQKIRRDAPARAVPSGVDGALTEQQQRVLAGDESFAEVKCGRSRAVCVW